LRLAAFAGIVLVRAAPPSRAEGGAEKGFPEHHLVCAPWHLNSWATVPAWFYPIDQRDALRMLDGSPVGSTEAIMMAHGFAIGTLQELVRKGFAMTERRTMRAGQQRVAVNWLAITDAGRLALAG
jgi:hypothetical protein